MATLDVFNMKREKVGSIDLSDEVFATEVKEHLFYEVIKAQLASRRQGTQAGKERSAVSGSTKKLYKQKGTGRARHGSIRAPIYVGGGRAHPTRPRDWSYRPPRQVRLGALKSALSKFNKEGRLVVVDRFELAEVKTKGLLAALGALKVTTPREGTKSAKALVVDVAANENLKLSIRNSDVHQYLPPEGVNLYDLLRHDTLVLSKDAAKLLEQRCLRIQPAEADAAPAATKAKALKVAKPAKPATKATAATTTAKKKEATK
jgi:large subunit ribosomal protein L4